MWLFDKLMNRKIEGKSSLDNVEPLLEKVDVSVSDDAFLVKLPDDVNVQGKRLAIDFSTQDGVNNAQTSIKPSKITLTGVDAVYSLVNGDYYVSISPIEITIGDESTYNEGIISLDVIDRYRTGLYVPQSRGSAIDNIPILVESVEDFGTKSADFTLDFSTKGKYTFTQIVGSVEGNVSCEILLPSFVKRVITSGSETNRIVSNSSSVIYVDGITNCVTVEEDGFILNVLITDYIAYVFYNDEL